jgi:hypothetical protein
MHNGVLAMRYLTDATRRQFFTLLPGTNTMAYNADINVVNLDVLFEYKDTYLGV